MILKEEEKQCIGVWVQCGHMICLCELWPILWMIFVALSADRRPDWPCDGGHHSCVKNAGGSVQEWMGHWDSTLMGQYPGEDTGTVPGWAGTHCCGEIRLQTCEKNKRNTFSNITNSIASV